MNGRNRIHSIIGKSRLQNSGKSEDSGNTKVRLELFDLYGKRIATLMNEPLRAAAHTVTFDTREMPLPTGTYVYRLQYRGESVSRKMRIIK